MHDSFSNHNESIHSLASQIWPARYRFFHVEFRPSLNIKQLVSLIQIATSRDAQDSSMSAVKGKKRVAILPSNHVRAAKRIKTSEGTIMRGTSEESTDDFVLPTPIYPLLSSKTEHYDKSFNDNETVPVYRHVYEIQYSKAPSGSVALGGDNKLRSRWESEEKYLQGIIAELRSSLSEPRTIDLGNVHFAEHHDRLIMKGREGWLLLLPTLSSDIDLSWQDIASQSVEDISMAFHILQSARRVRMNGRLKMILLPLEDDGTAQQGLPFRLQVVASVSLLVPSIFEPLTSRGMRRSLSEIGDAQRRVLNFLYPSTIPVPDSFEGTFNIPFFYSVLGPAPPIPPPAYSAMQPIGLLPTLLPFQCRSLAWLLDREGKTIMGGEVVPKVASSDFTLWDKVEEGNYTWYHHRLSGILSPTLPQMPPVLGGILAEEPGLGKTLEIIALILSNPAPHDRNPTVKRWDPEAKLEVRAIKVRITTDFYCTAAKVVFSRPL
jgi:E3 ubiquitin-protein ligase SHPRH